MADIQREFNMTQTDFSVISELAYNYTGIVLGEHKQDMVYGRLARRMRALRLSDFSDYCPLISDPSSQETGLFINALTTNLTAFFRESHHFDFLANTVCKEYLQRTTGERKIRAWSAACSTGEEPYSMALVLRENIDCRHWDCKVLATDLDSKVLQHAKQGIYDNERLKDLSSTRKKKWFLHDRNHPDIAKVKPSLQELIRFKRLNLLESWPMRGSFDLIFCRNVMIYFDIQTQQKMLNGFASILKPGGYLFIGHSENLHGASVHFESMGQTIFKRK